MQRPGPSLENRRQLPGNMFAVQPNPPNRGAPLPTNRLQQTGKPAAPSWFGMGGASALGVANNSQSRANNAGIASFAQTLGGGQQQSSLDPSEFPSLSGAPQPQQPVPNTSQSMWGANASIRNTQQTPVQNQRQLPQMPSQASLQSQSQAQINAQSMSGHSPSEDSFAPGGEGYRFGNQGSINPLQGLSQTQTSNSSQPRSSLTSPGGEPERLSRTAISGAPGLPIPQELRGRTSGEIGSQPPGLPTPQQMQQPFGQDALSSPQNTIPGQMDTSMKRLADMTDSERWGMPGLFALLNRDHPDFNEFQSGVDLTQLGMDLNRSDNDPLHAHFGVAFLPPTAAQQPPIIPSYTLPTAYTVTNVPPLESRISSFSEETLFAIFYQFPRDLRQELAAQELHLRDWRWHRELRQWMQKDTMMPPPMRVNAQQENGYYVFFDASGWKRERKEFLLNYEHLEQRPTQGASQPAFS